MNKIIIPRFDTKKMAEEIKKEWDIAHNNNEYHTVVISIDETIELLGEKVQAYLRENIDSNLSFQMYVDDECDVHYYLGYNIAKGYGCVDMSSYKGDGHRRDYGAASSEISVVLRQLTVENLKFCKDFAELIKESSKMISLVSGNGESIRVNDREGRISIPVDLSAYRAYKDIIEYFIKNPLRILNARKRPISGQYFLHFMNVVREEENNEISYIQYGSLDTGYRVC